MVSERCYRETCFLRFPDVAFERAFDSASRETESSIEAVLWQTEESGSFEKDFEGEHRWTAPDRTVIARMEHHLNKSDSMRVLF